MTVVEDARREGSAGFLGRVHRRAGSLLYALLVVFALSIILGLSMGYRKQWDLSVTRQNSLVPQTLEVLSRLPDDVKLYALFTRREPRRDRYWNLLHTFRIAGPRLAVEFVDPVARPGTVKALGLSGQDEGGRLDGVTVAVRGRRQIVFRGVEEPEVTSALLEVLSDQRRVIGMIRGYGEMDPESSADAGFNAAAEALRSEYYDVRDVLLSEEIPADVTGLILAGARAPVPEPDLERLGAWLRQGGRLLALVEAGEDASALNRVLEPWGLRCLGLHVLDLRENVFGNPELLRITDYSRHKVVAGFGKNLPTVLPMARPVEHFDPGEPLLFRDDLLRSSAVSMGFAPDGTRTQGPFSLATASWRRIEGGRLERETRVVLVGAAGFASNLYLPKQANRNFFLNCVGWLAREQALVAIRRQVLGGQDIDLTFTESRRVALVTFATPVLVLLTGIAVFARRRML